MTSSAGDEWSAAYPRMRLYGFAFDGTGYVAEIIEHDGYDVETAIEDGDYHFTDTGKLFSLAVTGEHGTSEPTWLLGGDYRVRPTSRAEHRRRRDMQQRYLMSRSRLGEPIVLPDGLRVVRMFPEWGGAGPLWESFTDNYPADPSKLGISVTLADELESWNDHWNARDPEDDLPDARAWLATGRHLYHRVQDELDGVAEVVPEFDAGDPL
ncbi:hypothetical protein RD149_18825 [Gordonia westfalica]|uniref:Uncharacterized protein n=1 Tax=Gordonia westfalica TaxID=158898 RepID=A0ABU2GWK0_9ACTN|nr:hypothetical protein [Gordonia westfalica]MDS1115805.1 hypothetical protein [Gordonia westfalica]